MDEPLVLLGWTIGGTVAFGSLGALFGGLSGWLNWRGGHTSGTGVGRRVAAALAQLGAEELTPAQSATLVGAVDGGFFLGLLGTLVGLIAARAEVEPGRWLVPLFLITLALVVATLILGAMALGLVRLKIPAVVALFVGGMSGALGAFFLYGSASLFPGLIVGILLGTCFALVVLRKHKR